MSKCGDKCDKWVEEGLNVWRRGSICHNLLFYSWAQSYDIYGWHIDKGGSQCNIQVEEESSVTSEWRKSASLQLDIGAEEKLSMTYEERRDSVKHMSRGGAQYNTWVKEEFSMTHEWRRGSMRDEWRLSKVWQMRRGGTQEWPMGDKKFSVIWVQLRHSGYMIQGGQWDIWVEKGLSITYK